MDYSFIWLKSCRFFRVVLPVITVSGACFVTAFAAITAVTVAATTFARLARVAGIALRLLVGSVLVLCRRLGVERRGGFTKSCHWRSAVMPLAVAPTLALALVSLGGLQSCLLVAATVIAATIAFAAFAPAFRVAILALWRCIRAHCCSHGGLVG